MPDALTDQHPETRAEIQEALTSMAATAARMPAHWAERKAAIHKQINQLLTDLENAPA